MTFGANGKHLLSSTDPGNILMVLKGSIFYQEPILATYLFIVINILHNHTSSCFHVQSCQIATFTINLPLLQQHFWKVMNLQNSGPRNYFNFKNRLSLLSVVTTRAKNSLSPRCSKCPSSKVCHCIITQMRKMKQMVPSST